MVWGLSLASCCCAFSGIIRAQGSVLNRQDRLATLVAESGGQMNSVNALPILSVSERVKRAERWDGGFNPALAREAAFGFLSAEAQLGMTFARIALGGQDGDGKARRNTINARKAYDCILKFKDRVLLSHRERAKLGGAVEDLRAVLETLGEGV
jgi:hypothetical protein